MVELEDTSSLMAILEDEDFSPMPPRSSQAGSNLPPGGLASTPGIVTAAEGQGESGVPGPALDSPSDLSWGEYIQKFKETFLKARPLDQVAIHASTMPFGDFMDYAVKLFPKDVKIQGEVNFRHLVQELGPVDKSQYLLPDESVIDVEHTEINE